MKHGKRPTATQRKFIEKAKLDPEEYLVIKNLPNALELINRETEETLTLTIK